MKGRSARQRGAGYTLAVLIVASLLMAAGTLHTDSISQSLRLNTLRVHEARALAAAESGLVWAHAILPQNPVTEGEAPLELATATATVTWKMEGAGVYLLTSRGAAGNATDRIEVPLAARLVAAPDGTWHLERQP
jgi:hypothetical protein